MAHFLLQQQGNCLMVTPWAAYLEPECTGWRMDKRVMDQKAWAIYHNLPVNKQRQYLFERTQFPLFSVEKATGVGHTYAGLLDRIQARITRNGDTYRAEVPGTYPVPAFDAIPNFDWRFRQREDTEKLMSGHCGLLQWPPGVGKSQVIAPVALAYTKDNLLIVCKGLPLVNQLAERLAVYNVPVSRCSGTKKFDPKMRVCLCSLDSIHKIPDGWPTILLMDEVQCAGSLRVCQELSRFQRTRMFGMSATPMHRSDGTNRCVEAVFGPVNVVMTYDEAIDAGLILPIDVWQVRYKGDGQPLRGIADTVLRRHGIWRNQDRNGCIAAHAKALISYGCKQMLISVKTTEHGLFLRKLLPGFHLVHGPIKPDDAVEFVRLGIMDQSEVLSPDIEAMRMDFLAQRLRYVITTPCWWTGINFPELSYLFRAEGEASAISLEQLGGRTNRTSAASGKDKAVLIDMYDEHHPIFEKFSKQRFAQYKKLGWACTPWE